MPVLQEKSAPMAVQMFQLITPQAEKLVEALLPQDRLKVVRALEQPVRMHRCKKMKSAPFWRVRITDDIRITFCRLGSGLCVVHAGYHTESDHFVDHVDNGLPLNPNFLKESSIMKKNPVAPKLQDRTNYTTPAANANDWHEMMERGFKGLVDHLMVDQLDVIRDLSLEQINEMGKQVERQVEAYAKLSARVNDLAGDVDRSKADQASHADGVLKLGIAVRTEAKRQGDAITQSLEKTVQEQNKEIAGVREKLGQVAVLTEERFSALAKVVDSQEQRTADLSEEVARLAQQVAAAGNTMQTVASRLDQMEGELRRLDTTMALIAMRHDTAISVLADWKKASEERQAEAASRTWSAWLQRLAKTIKARFTKTSENQSEPRNLVFSGAEDESRTSVRLPPSDARDA